MTPGTTSMVDELAPIEAFNVLSDDPNSLLIDVRTRAEWSFVGMPDLSTLGKETVPIEWVSFPDMTQNAKFLEQIEQLIGGESPPRLMFICRSGSRSMAAARTVAAAMDQRGRTIHCTNIAEGFEGDLDAERHRSSHNGWRARGLPWQQA